LGEREKLLSNIINKKNEKIGNNFTLTQENNNLRKKLEEMETELKVLDEKIVEAVKQILHKSEVIKCLKEENENLIRKTAVFKLKFRNLKRK
jgi:hypothetical protein